MAGARPGVNTSWHTPGHVERLGDDQGRGDAAGLGGEDDVGLKEGQASGQLVGQLEDEAGLDAVIEEVVDAQDLARSTVASVSMRRTRGRRGR
jgi:hypothetical protein